MLGRILLIIERATTITTILMRKDRVTTSLETQADLAYQENTIRHMVTQDMLENKEEMTTNNTTPRCN